MSMLSVCALFSRVLRAGHLIFVETDGLAEASWSGFASWDAHASHVEKFFGGWSPFVPLASEACVVRVSVSRRS